MGPTAVFGIGFGVGSALDPVHEPDTTPEQHSVPAHDKHDDVSAGPDH